MVEAFCIVRAIVATRQEKLEADAKVADANRRAEKARLATETLMAENLRLQTVLQPRTVALLGRNGDASIRTPKLDELKRHAGTQLLLQIVADFEAQKLGVAIRGLAKFVGWNAQEVVAVSQGNIREGVVIITVVSPPRTPKKAEAAVPPPAARALLEFLQLDLGPSYGPVLPFGVMWTPVIEGTERSAISGFRPGRS